ncbi:hypothetical protein [Enterococcus cecorum]|uniref:hypothetical protein n=1 Tax=Enterococcus cecorum TaxID=44008 RepID=UPI002ACC1AFA|nr:hypothetical protein [Enterococcus cecorum]
MNESLIKDNKRVQQHGEVFTPDWIIEKMLAMFASSTRASKPNITRSCCSFLPHLSLPFYGIRRDLGLLPHSWT